MPFAALGEFVRYLESIGDLHRVKVEVDPRLELTEIATRALKEDKPALFFERVRGAKYPVVMMSTRRSDGSSMPSANIRSR